MEGLKIFGGPAHATEFPIPFRKSNFHIPIPIIHEFMGRVGCNECIGLNGHVFYSLGKLILRLHSIYFLVAL